MFVSVWTFHIHLVENGNQENKFRNDFPPLCDDPKILALRLTALESVKPLNKIDRSFWPKTFEEKKSTKKALTLKLEPIVKRLTTHRQAQDFFPWLERAWKTFLRFFLTMHGKMHFAYRISIRMRRRLCWSDINYVVA